MKILYITNCTNRKRIKPTEMLCARTLPSGSSVEVAAQWAFRLQQCDVRHQAKDLYCGRSFSEVLAARKKLEGQLLIVSAGLGLVYADTMIPSYNATLSSSSEDSVLKRTGGSSIEWWNEITTISPYSAELTPQSGDIVLVAVSRPYFNFLAELFENWTESDLKKVRLFVRIPVDELAHKLQPCLMPYDARFDHPDGPRPGTQADFAQRSLYHFVANILSFSATSCIQDHIKLVNEHLNHLSPPERPNRTKVTDLQVQEIIRTHWLEVDGKSGQMLRMLRRKLGVACEQSRFKCLFNQVRESMTKSVGN